MNIRFVNVVWVIFLWISVSNTRKNEIKCVHEDITIETLITESICLLKKLVFC